MQGSSLSWSDAQGAATSRRVLKNGVPGTLISLGCLENLHELFWCAGYAEHCKNPVTIDRARSKPSPLSTGGQAM